MPKPSHESLDQIEVILKALDLSFAKKALIRMIVGTILLEIQGVNERLDQIQQDLDCIKNQT